MNIVWNVSALVTGQPATKREVEAGLYFRNAIAAFAADPEEGMNVLGWPTFAKNESNVNVMGTNSSNFHVVGSDAAVEKLCLDVFGEFSSISVESCWGRECVWCTDVCCSYGSAELLSSVMDGCWVVRGAGDRD